VPTHSLQAFRMHAWVLGLALVGCDVSAPVPPPPPGFTASADGKGGTVSTVEVTLSASSVPPGATVMVGDDVLGTAPITAQVPFAPSIPVTFVLRGYQTTTLNAVPVNNSATVVATLNAGENDGSGATRTIHARGIGGGPIFDYHTTTARAVVSESCLVDRLAVTINGHHSFHSDLIVSLRSPAGSSYTLQRQRQRNPFRTHVVPRAAGRPGTGEWVLSIRDNLGSDSGRLNGFSMELGCR